jgi:dienelactone hydrolase
VSLVFRATCALLALHTVVDAFLAPQRGTRWTDHLSAGFVPLALLLVAVLLYRRAPALLSLLVGAFAFEAFALALADASRTFDRASDWTGLLLGPCALALLIQGVLLLWRRRPFGMWRIAGAVAGTIVALYVVVVPVAMAVYATHRPRAEATPVAGFRAVELLTSDGLTLAGLYAPPRNGAAVVSFPTRLGKVAVARMLHRHGYGVLIVDMRGYEGSEGAPNAFGWGATKDVDAAVAWLRARGLRRIGGIGFSVGGEHMHEAAADNPHLLAVVSDGAGERSVRESVLRGVRGWPALPSMAVQSVAVSALSQTAPPPPLDDAVAQIAPRAAFFVYSEHGGGAEDLTPAFYRAAQAPKALWRVPDAGHTGGFAAHPRAYERRVVGFFDRYLGV